MLHVLNTFDKNRGTYLHKYVHIRIKHMLHVLNTFDKNRGTYLHKYVHIRISMHRKTKMYAYRCSLIRAFNNKASTGYTPLIKYMKHMHPYTYVHVNR